MGYDQKFVFESMQDAKSIRQYLEAVVEGLENGRITVSTGEQQFTMEPRDLLTFTVKARKRGGEGRLSLTISWRCPVEDGPKPGETLTIEG